MIINRRKLITGLIAFGAAPAIVRIENLMPVKVMIPTAVGTIIYYARYEHLCLMVVADVFDGKNWVTIS